MKFAALASLLLFTAATTGHAADSRCGVALATLATKAAMLQRFDEDLTDQEKTELFTQYQVGETRLGRAKRELRKKMVNDSNTQTVTCVALGATSPLSDDEGLSDILSVTGRTLISAYLDESLQSNINKRQVRLTRRAVKNCRAEIIDLIQFAAKSRNVRKFKDEEKKGEYLLGMADRVADYCSMQGQIVAIDGALNEFNSGHLYYGESVYQQCDGECPNRKDMGYLVRKLTGRDNYWTSLGAYSDYQSSLLKVSDHLKLKSSYFAKNPKIKDGELDATPEEIVPEYDDLYPRW